MASVSVDVEIDDIIESLWRKSDKLELLESLLNDLDPKDVIQVIRNHENYEDKSNQVRETLLGDDYNFASACDKLRLNRWRMDLKDEEYVLKLAERL